MVSATKRQDAKLATRANFASSNLGILTTRDAGEGMARALSGHTISQVTYIAHVSEPTAKDWFAGKRCPHTANTINLARGLPNVKAWVIEELDKPLNGGGPVLPPPDLTTVVADLQMLAMRPGQDGAVARAMLEQLRKTLGA